MTLPGTPDAPTPAKRILVADDDAAIGMYIEMVLAQEGYQTVLVENGEAAARQYRDQGPFDLAILDVHMPLLDGQGALEQIRALHPAARGLVLSGTPVEREGCLPQWAQGFDGFLCKPFAPADLLREVVRLLHAKPAA